jgi:plasmid stabilization system protein ParE
MAKIKWSKDLLEDLKEIYRFIAIDSPYYANMVRDRIIESCIRSKKDI